MVLPSSYKDSGTIWVKSYTIMEEGLVKIMLDQDDRANKFCYMIGDWPFK